MKVKVKMVSVLNIGGETFHEKFQNFIEIYRNVLCRAATSRYYWSSGGYWAYASLVKDKNGMCAVW